ncbi:MAG: MGMT family protein [Gammaproteobacteria bacterium]|jgi:methylated-DNA-[protein]-cysteine S-methyltransferase
MKHYQASIKTPFAHLGLCFSANKLTAIDFIESDKEIKPRDETAVSVCNQIRQYVQSPKGDSAFEIMYSIQGTSFQKKVWSELKKIPPGKVITYGQLAQKLDTSARAVGNACRKNPIPLVIPCHRVVSSNGIGGYAGDTQGGLVQVKSWLLTHEGVAVP